MRLAALPFGTIYWTNSWEGGDCLLMASFKDQLQPFGVDPRELCFQGGSTRKDGEQGLAGAPGGMKNKLPPPEDTTTRRQGHASEDAEGADGPAHCSAPPQAPSGVAAYSSCTAPHTAAPGHLHG